MSVDLEPIHDLARRGHPAGRGNQHAAQVLERHSEAVGMRTHLGRDRLSVEDLYAPDTALAKDLDREFPRTDITPHTPDSPACPLSKACSPGFLAGLPCTSVTPRPLDDQLDELIEQAIGILDLPLPDPPPIGAEWIHAFRRWAG